LRNAQFPRSQGCGSVTIPSTMSALVLSFSVLYGDIKSTQGKTRRDYFRIAVIRSESLSDNHRGIGLLRARPGSRLTGLLNVCRFGSLGRVGVTLAAELRWRTTELTLKRRLNAASEP
jgi:hypothetical protein